MKTQSQQNNENETRDEEINIDEMGDADIQEQMKKIIVDWSMLITNRNNLIIITHNASLVYTLSLKR